MNSLDLIREGYKARWIAKTVSLTAGQKTLIFEDTGPYLIYFQLFNGNDKNIAVEEYMDETRVSMTLQQIYNFGLTTQLDGFPWAVKWDEEADDYTVVWTPAEAYYPVTIKHRIFATATKDATLTFMMKYLKKE